MHDEESRRAALVFAARNAVAGALVSTQAAALAEAVIKSLVAIKFKIAAVLALAGTLVATGGGAIIYYAANATIAAPPSATPSAHKTTEAKPTPRAGTTGFRVPIPVN